MTEKNRRFADFPIPDYTDWKAAAESALKGAPFDKKMYYKTYEEITLNPIYSEADLKDKEYLNSEFPGLPAFLRGSTPAGYKGKPWLVAQDLNINSPEEFNKAALSALAKGQTALNIKMRDCFKNKGVNINSLADLETALEGIDIAQTPVFLRAKDSAYAVAAALDAYCEKYSINKAMVQGSVECDPLCIYGRDGAFHASKEQYYDELAELVNWAELNYPQLKVIGVNSGQYHEAGANAVQEIAYILATASEYIHELTEREIPFERLTNKFKVNVKVSSNFFMEIAKVKALRFLFSKLYQAFRLDLEPEAPFIHIETSSRNKSALDPYVNMLRTTVESLSAVLGGCDSLSVSNFNSSFAQADEFSSRVSRNQQYIIKDEAHITDTIDPSSGSWLIESLIYELAEKAWAKFKEIEAFGGMFEYLQAGKAQEEIKAVANKRLNDLYSRKETLLGVNKYPNLNEELRNGKTKYNDEEFTQAIDIVDTSLISLTNHIKNGADFRSIMSAIHNVHEYQTLALHPVKLAGDFEELRVNAAAYKSANGSNPKVLLLNFGALKEYKGRADFSSDFFAVGGFESVWSQSLNSVEDAAKAYLEADLEVAVICSTDDKYAEFAAPLVRMLKKLKPLNKVILAGLPANLVDELKAAGIDEFIHIKANVYDILKNLQDELGIAQVKEANQGAAL